MALVIENPETERLVEELARRTGRSPAEVVADAVRDLLNGPQGKARTASAEFRREAARARIREIQRPVAAIPDSDSRSADEIIGNDEQGVPR